MARRPYSVHRLAEREIEHERGYYQRRAARGAELVAAVEEAFGRMREAPARFALAETVRGVPVRSVRVKRFPFRVYFGDLGDVLRVYAVGHVRRRPLYWARRVER